MSQAAPAKEPRLPRPVLAAVGAVLAWFVVQLAPFLGEAPDLDAMLTLRESLIFHREGLDGVIVASAGGGIHPPLLDVLSSGAFLLLGEDPRSQQLISVALFAVLVAAVERFLSPWLGSGQRILAALAVAICPSVAISLFIVSYEGLLVVVLGVALALALAPGPGARRPLVLGAVLALLPLIKETGLVLVFPFAVHAALTGAGGDDLRARVRRGAVVLALPVAAALAWRIVVALEGTSVWHTWVLSPHADDGPYAVALRAMLGLEDPIFLRQNLTNAFVVNFLWLPALLACGSVVLLARRPAPAGLRRAAVLVGGLAVVYTWTVLTFPTYTEPRYAVPLTLLTLLLVLLGLPLWPRRLRPVVLGALLVTAAAGAWTPADPVSRGLFGTTSVGGEQIYATAELMRGPDRMVYNLAILRASRRMNARLRRLYATDATLVTGDCDTMKFGEKLFSVGLTPSAYDRGIPAARPLRCVRTDELPPDAAKGSQRIAVVRTLEEDARGEPPPLSGPSIVVVR